ncbi:MAG TPA: hypothetical protein ENN61_04425, partial [Bacteroidaceae bacterium]|nr:hypothetical protein [Bacteroidaceae bacterium]
MNLRLLLYGFLVVFLPAYGQFSLPDTIPFGSPLLKGSGEYVVQEMEGNAITVVINELLAKNSGGIRDEAGDDDDWFELLNYGDEPVNLNTLWFTDNKSKPCKWRILSDEPVLLNPGEYMIFWADDEPWEGFNHTTFKLSGDGEYLGIYSGDLNVVDESFFGVQSPNVSYGRFPDGGMSWFYFDNPTPGGPNDRLVNEYLLPLPHSNIQGGIFTDPVSLQLTTGVDRGEIRYTLDCSDPDKHSQLFNDALYIDSTTIVRARIFKEGAVDGPILSLSFLFEDHDYENPVFSLVADPKNLYG